MRLRRADAGDAGKLALLGGASFLESFADDHPGDALVAHVENHHSRQAYAALLDDPAYAIWIFEHEAGAPTGYAVLGPPGLPGSNADDVELKRIYLLSRWHGTGLGKALFAAVEDEARARGAPRLLLSVYTENHKARAFYEARGFAVIGETHFAEFPAAFADFVMVKPL